MLQFRPVRTPPRGALIIALTSAAVGALQGCSATYLRTPLGSYLSNRDTSIDELHVIVDEPVELGMKRTEVKVNGAAGQSSPVVDAQAALLRAAIEGAVSGATKAAIGGGGQ